MSQSVRSKPVKIAPPFTTANAAEMGRKGGSSKSAKKIKAVNENLKKAWMASKKCKNCKVLRYCTIGQKNIEKNPECKCDADAVRYKVLRAIDDPDKLKDAAMLMLASMKDLPLARLHEKKTVINAITLVKKMFYPESQKVDLNISATRKEEFVIRMEKVMKQIERHKKKDNVFEVVEEVEDE